MTQAEIITVSKKGQIVLPKDIRETLGIISGSKLFLVQREDKLTLTKIESLLEKEQSEENDDVVIQRDSNGNILVDGDSIIVIKDLKLKGSSTVIKKGAKAKNIRLTDKEGEIECSIDGMRGIVLKTEFIKKA